MSHQPSLTYAARRWWLTPRAEAYLDRRRGPDEPIPYRLTDRAIVALYLQDRGIEGSLSCITTTKTSET